MKYINTNEGHGDADSADDAVSATALLEQRIAATEEQIATLPANTPAQEKARLQLQIIGSLLDLSRGSEAFPLARAVFDDCIAAHDWEQAVIACDMMYKADQEFSLPALGQGIWLAVTFPVDPELSVALLQHVVEETPNDSDGAAVAATVAHYLADMRAEGKTREELMIFTNNLLGSVARRHSKVESQEQFDFWFTKLELDDPEKFLPRLRNVVDVLVQEDWWLDRDKIWERIQN